MNNNENTFPTVTQLWNGIVLRTIAHAFWSIHHPLLAYERSWDGPNYIIQDSMGSRGVITFIANKIIGAFFESNSSRNPFHTRNDCELETLLKGMPSYLLEFAHKETLQYMLDDYNGTIAPIITSAFWSKENQLFAAESWSQVFAHGVHLIRTELMSSDTALVEYQDAYELSPRRISVIQSLFNRRIATQTTLLQLSRSEYELLTNDGLEGIDDCRDLLRAIGIVFP